MVDVKGRWALITGASRGIGYLAAKFMAEHGCNLILQARKKENLEKVIAEVREMGVEAYPVAAELSDLAAVERMLQEVDALGKNVEIVLNNAGLQIAYRTEFLTTPVSDYVESFKINTVAPMMITYHFLPKMVEQGFGRIVNTTSGIRREPEQAGYSASKAALDKVTMDLANVYNGTDVMINLADPGWCRTDLGGPAAPNSPESAIPGVVLGAFMDDKVSGRCYAAPLFHGMTFEEALEHAKTLPQYLGSLD